jgi:hypothetical protein
MTKPNGFPESWPPNGTGTGPWWIRAIYMLGVPAAIAVFLMYFVTVGLTGEIKGLRDDVRSHMREQSALIFYLQAICRGVAADARACEPPR